MTSAARTHVEALAGAIGARGSCTPEEARGHAYCSKTLSEMGYAPHTEAFRAPLSVWMPYALASGLALLAAFLFYTQGGAGALAGAALMLLVVSSTFLQLAHRDNALRWLLPTGESQNVWAQCQPAQAAAGTVVFVAHVDTHRHAWVMSASGPFLLLRTLSTLAPAAYIGLLLVCIVRLFAPLPELYPISLVLAALALPVFGLALWPDFTRFVPGANDNASGVAAVLEYAARLRVTPLRSTRVIFLFTGCEEVGAFGAAAFARQHPELSDANYLVVDNIGGRDTHPHYLLSETLLTALHPDPALLAVAERVAAEHASRPIMSRHLQASFTDLTPLALAGRRAIAFVSYRASDGMIPDWHQPTDTVARMDWDAYARTREYVWSVLQALDERG